MCGRNFHFFTNLSTPDIYIITSNKVAAERAFSCFKYSKKYLRSTQTDKRMENILVIYIEIDSSNSI